MDALQAEAERLRIAIDAMVPADDFPWASHAGAGNLAPELQPTGPIGWSWCWTCSSVLPRTQRVVGPVQEVTSADSRVRLDPR